MRGAIISREAILILALALLAGSSWWLDTDAPTPNTDATVKAIEAALPELAPAATTVATPAEAEAEAAPDRSHQLELPDGTFVDALNGAVDVAPLSQFWGPMPWSPIIGIERSSAGIDWYRHTDGSYSTTQMVWRADLGQKVAMTRVAHPGPEPAAIAAK